MAKAVGRRVKAAFLKGVTWGTAAAAGAGNGILILPPTYKKTRADLIDDSLGIMFPVAADVAEIHVDSVSIPAYLRYDSLDLLIALAMGATGGVPVQQGLTTAYAQKFTLADTLDGLFGTFVANLGPYLDELTSVKLTGFTIKGQVGKPLDITFDLIAIDRVTNSAVNTALTFANVTFFETANRVLYGQGVIRMNAQGGAALGAGDVIYPSGFELAYKRSMKGIYGASGTFDKIDEPTDDGMPTVGLKLDFPSDVDATIFTDWDANNLKKLDMTFTGPSIAAPYNRQLVIACPNMKIKDADAPITQGIITKTVNFTCLGCDVAPTGMTATKPFEIDVVNRQSVNVLA